MVRNNGLNFVLVGGTACVKPTALSDEFIAYKEGFWRVPEIDFRYEAKAKKVMVDFKFNALYR